MPVTDCLTADTLTAGQTHRARLHFSRAQVDAYCALTGDASASRRHL
jgi:hypothetical protein